MRALLFAALLAASVSPVIGNDKPFDLSDGDYVKVEVRGKLKFSFARNGDRLQSAYIYLDIFPPTFSWELQLGKNKKLLQLAKQLKDKKVVVTGSLQAKVIQSPIGNQPPHFAFGGPPLRLQYVVQVKSINAAK